MSTQIAVRLPDEVMSFVDQAVSDGKAPSRAALVVRALRREMRRQAAERDAEILASTPPDEDMDAFVAWAFSDLPLGD
ncbi:MAG: YlcI/YnfO family protein [Dermatophilus congolensis]|nr:YlcI/YnfO family protein [Dermatophilus congolensis]